MSSVRESGALYHLGEEIANAVTHGLGLALAIAGLAVMVTLAAFRGNAWVVVSCSIYGSTLVLLYLSSTLYHAFPWHQKRTKKVFQIFDHSAIYLLIAGTYTPFILVRLRTPLGITLLAIVWGVGIVGVVFKSINVDGWGFLSTCLYVIMGWMAILAARPMIHALTWRGMGWLIAGGVLYTAGVVFYAFRRKYFHAVWHVFVLGGSVAHYFAILFFVVLR